jgi:hypothetical protein
MQVAKHLGITPARLDLRFLHEEAANYPGW